jgi:acetylornithine deacetylase/succinyl-diaminopimelate desuccinylase-like protein
MPIASLFALALVAASPAPRSFDDEVRATLAEMVAVDTSHGNETALLKPIAARLKAAGLASELVESAPGRGNLVARYKGNGAKKPLLVIAHVDVVPVESQPWTVPPFTLTEKDGFLWGRGVNDQKAMAAVMVALALELARTKPALSRDIIFAWTAGEETGGFDGAQWLAQKRKDLIDAEIALNEGGGVRLDDTHTRVSEVLIGVAEKTFQSYRLVVKGRGGHSSQPPTDVDPVVTLAKALIKVGDVRFTPHVMPAVKDSLPANIEVEKGAMKAALERIYKNGKVSAADAKTLRADRAFNAMFATTCVTTQLLGSPQDNVLPTTAEAIVNCRIMPDETPAQVQAALEKAIGDANVVVTPTKDFGFGPSSPETGVVPDAIRKVAAARWPDAKVHFAMSTGATDSRHLRAAGIPAYGIGASPVSKAEGMASRVAHGPDERRPTKWLGEGAAYMKDVVLELAR